MAVVFTDNFTNSGGAGVDIDTWQSAEQASGSSDWDYQPPTPANALKVSHTTQRLVAGAGWDAGSVFNTARIVNAALSGLSDYKITGVLKWNNGFEYGALCARLHASQLSGYMVVLNPSLGGNDAVLYRIDNGTLVSLDAVASGGLTIATASLKVEGTTITWTLGAVGPRSVTDATYAGGPPGVGLHGWGGVFGTPSEANLYSDTITVESLAAATTIRPITGSVTCVSDVPNATLSVNHVVPITGSVTAQSNVPNATLTVLHVYAITGTVTGQSNVPNATLTQLVVRPITGSVTGQSNVPNATLIAALLQPITGQADGQSTVNTPLLTMTTLTSRTAMFIVM
jgi:hypothetical protein